jgi:hypothetical protein
MYRFDPECEEAAKWRIEIDRKARSFIPSGSQRPNSEYPGFTTRTHDSFAGTHRELANPACILVPENLRQLEHPPHDYQRRSVINVTRLQDESPTINRRCRVCPLSFPVLCLGREFPGGRGEGGGGEGRSETERSQLLASQRRNLHTPLALTQRSAGGKAERERRGDTRTGTIARAPRGDRSRRKGARRESGRGRDFKGCTHTEFQACARHLHGISSRHISVSLSPEQPPRRPPLPSALPPPPRGTRPLDTRRYFICKEPRPQVAVLLLILCAQERHPGAAQRGAPRFHGSSCSPPLSLSRISLVFSSPFSLLFICHTSHGDFSSLSPVRFPLERELKERRS